MCIVLYYACSVVTMNILLYTCSLLYTHTQRSTRPGGSRSPEVTLQIHWTTHEPPLCSAKTRIRRKAPIVVKPDETWCIGRYGSWQPSGCCEMYWSYVFCTNMTTGLHTLSTRLAVLQYRCKDAEERPYLGGEEETSRPMRSCLWRNAAAKIMYWSQLTPVFLYSMFCAFAHARRY